MNQATIKWLSPKKINRMTALSYQGELTGCILIVLHVQAHKSQTGVRHNSSVKMSHFQLKICCPLNLSNYLPLAASLFLVLQRILLQTHKLTKRAK